MRGYRKEGTRLKKLSAFSRLALGALTFLCVAAKPSFAAPPPPEVWMPLQSKGVGWQNGQFQPLADGTIIDEEYANGIKVDLNDFSNSVPQGNGALYLTVSDNVTFTPQQCIKTNGSPCKGGTLFIGLRVHAANAPIGSESGQVTLYIDAKRQATLDSNSCTNQNGAPTTKAAGEDRKIVVSYSSQFGQASPSLQVTQFSGNCNGWTNGPFPSHWPIQAKAAREVAGSGGKPNFLEFELAITAQPLLASPLSSKIVKDKLFGLGVLHAVHGAAGYGSFGHFPSLFNKKPADQDTWSWATINMKPPTRINLSMTAYNVGQLQITDDGGQGEAKDFAQLTYTHDIICLVEEMNADEREEVVEEINSLRASAGMDVMTPVYPGTTEIGDGAPPNNMLLVAGPIIDSDFVIYGDLPEVTADCADSECIGDGAGYKGIVWARVGVKKSEAIPPSGDLFYNRGKAETWFSDDFVDVFCTHTQADYDYDGQYAQVQTCSYPGNCAPGKYGPGGNPPISWSVNIREEQWDALRNWMRDKRDGGNGSPNGLDRPAFLLGDLNQIGPKGVSATDPNGDVKTWANNTAGQVGFGSQYKTMRENLGNWELSAFDQVNGWAWDLYDLMARDNKGTWIGNGGESNVTDTIANDCVWDYSILNHLKGQARVDYIMVLPAEGSFPFYSLVGPDANPAEPLIGISANTGPWEDGLGCASDHAQVKTEVGLVQTGVKANYNPNKKHKLTYRVSHLWDKNNSDGGDTDWFVPFLLDNIPSFPATVPPHPQFQVEHRNASNQVVDGVYNSYPDSHTLDGDAVPVTWHAAVYPKDNDKVRAGVWVWDWDAGPNDYYDGTDFEFGGDTSFVAPFFEFNHAYPGTFSSTGSLTFPGTNAGCTADPSSSAPDGSCSKGWIGIKTHGNGQGTDPTDDVWITHRGRVWSSLPSWAGPAHEELREVREL